MSGLWRLKAIRLAIALADRASPELAASMMLALWFSPPRTLPPNEAGPCLSAARSHVLDLHGFPVVTWVWGEGPSVLLMHGWGGNAGQMHAFVEPLMRAGFSVVAFDSPAHGKSGPSRRGNRRVTFFEMAEALKVVDASFSPIALVAHSGGCAAVALAIREGWQAPAKIAFVAPFAVPSEAVAAFAKTIGASSRVVERFRKRVERWLGRAWSYFDIPNLPSSMKNRSLLVVHDMEDREVAFEQGRVVAASWPQSTLFETRGLGHRRILVDPNVVAQVVGFFSSDVQVA